MNRRVFLSLALLTAPLRALAADTPRPSDYAATLAAAKDVPAVAVLLQEQMRRPLSILLQIKDTDSLSAAQKSLADVTTNIDAISKRLLELPQPSSAEREALSKKMAASDRAYLKTNQPALQAHLDSLPAELKEETMSAMAIFYKTVDDHKRVFEMYLKPGARPKARKS